MISEYEFFGYATAPQTLGEFMSVPLTYPLLRSRGFRIVTTQSSPSPHMARVFGRHDQALELSEPVDARQPSGDFGWFCWLRSDIAHSRCRFVFLRSVFTIEQLERLWLAITDTPLDEQPYDAEQFAQAIQREREDAERRYIEYAKYKPGKEAT